VAGESKWGCAALSLQLESAVSLDPSILSNRSLADRASKKLLLGDCVAEAFAFSERANQKGRALAVDGGPPALRHVQEPFFAAQSVERPRTSRPQPSRSQSPRSQPPRSYLRDRISEIASPRSYLRDRISEIAVDSVSRPGLDF
jgi:hypothetical protein